MPVSPTYPGVYIEEIPSGVHTITGVATSVTAFVGYTASGSVDTPVHIFSFADFERAFGGLSVDSPLSYAVKGFFQNGGTEAYIVRVASGAASATVRIQDTTAAARLVVTASGAGTWGNNLQIDVDYDTANPASLFNLSVTEYRLQNGQLTPNRRESFRNLSMNLFDAAYAIDTVNANSQIVRLAFVAPIPAPLPTGGASTSGQISAADLAALNVATRNRVAVLVDGRGPFEFDLPLPIGTTAALATQLVNLTNAAAGGGSVSGTSTATTVTISSLNLTSASSVHFLNASTRDASAQLHLGLANGGREVDGVAPYRPVQSGTVGVGPTLPLTGAGSILVDVFFGAAVTAAQTITLPVWTAPTPAPLTAAEIVTRLRAALATGAVTERYLVGATASLIGGVVRVVPGPIDPNISFAFRNNGADPTATELGLAGAARNVGHYAPGSGVTFSAQIQGAAGNNGTPPGAAQLSGNEAAKTGLYALENVDLFNLLVMPDATAGSGMMAVLTEAIAYCTRRRAFMLIDAPENVATFAQAQTWIGAAASPLRSRNAALYFPRLRAPDPMMNGVVRTFPAAGSLAGLYARTDAERGVWKAPAGTASLMVGADGLAVTLTDLENGVLNPTALNCLRTFPVIGTVAWGARTARGADALTDEYKYIPVRRLALFLEESLYRGTQWVVFEPNDEPLWAQIRLNLGAFMHTLFAQGAFQGQSARDAYFVKCDKETTTQNDIDLGRVNIVVGFAPLKPAEFVIIKIQQIARPLQT